MTVLVTSCIVMSILSLIFGVGLAFASRKLAVQVDDRVLSLKDSLPGVNCGACGFAGCQDYANAMVFHDAPVDRCAPGGSESLEKISRILGGTVTAGERQIVKVLCLGGRKETTYGAVYQGVATCAAAHLTGGGKDCSFGCLGLADCVASCKFDALRMNGNGLPVVDEDKCTGCGLCIKACPRSIIQFAPVSAYMTVNCRSTDRGPEVQKYCKVGCIGCGICVKAADGKGIRLEKNLALIDYAVFASDGQGAEKCPKKTMVFQKEKFEKRSVPRS